MKTATKAVARTPTAAKSMTMKTTMRTGTRKIPRALNQLSAAVSDPGDHFRHRLRHQHRPQAFSSVPSKAAPASSVAGHLSPLIFANILPRKLAFVTHAPPLAVGSSQSHAEVMPHILGHAEVTPRHPILVRGTAARGSFQQPTD